jgi:hypothetical protein
LFQALFEKILNEGKMVFARRKNRRVPHVSKQVLMLHGNVSRIQRDEKPEGVFPQFFGKSLKAFGPQIFLSVTIPFGGQQAGVQIARPTDSLFPELAKRGMYGFPIPAVVLEKGIERFHGTGLINCGQTAAHAGVAWRIIPHEAAEKIIKLGARPVFLY